MAAPFADLEARLNTDALAHRMKLLGLDTDAYRRLMSTFSSGAPEFAAAAAKGLGEGK